MIEVLLFLTALTGLGTAIVTFLTRREVEKVHVLVNSKFTSALRRIEQLAEALRQAGVAVPEATEKTKVEDVT